VNFYKFKIGKKPTDRKWQEFLDPLKDIFGECCGYCEGYCDGEVDHLKPKKRFPEEVYNWDNWVYSCHVCNNKKGEKWSSLGFLDPCSGDTFCDTPYCFEYELDTGVIKPNPKLNRRNRKSAQKTIDSLKLNRSNNLKSRIHHICLLESLVRSSKTGDEWAIGKLAEWSLPKAQYFSLTMYFREVNNI
jgi:uncharacterized protein (TIGR02646 family)